MSTLLSPRTHAAKFAVIALLIFHAVLPRVSASALTWDITPANGASITDGAGDWLNGAGNWNTGSGDATWMNATPDSAIFGSGGTAGTVTLTGAITAGGLTFNAVTGSYTVTGNTLTLSGSPTIAVNDDAATINSTLAGTTITKAGTGTLTLGGVNSYTGLTTVSTGTLQITSLSALGTTAAGTTVSNGAMLDISAAGTITGETLTLNGAGIGGNGALVVNSNGAWSGAVTASTASTVSVASGVTWNVSNAPGFTATGALTKIGAGTVTITGGITTGTGGIFINGGTIGVLDATGRLNSGVITVGNGGTLRTAGTGTDTIGGSGGSGAVIVAAGGTFDYQQNGATGESINSLALNGTGIGGAGALVNSAAVTTGILNLPAIATLITLQSDSTIGVSNASGVLVLGNTFGGPFGVTKVGAGSLKLTALSASAAYGVFTVNEGKIQLAPSSNNSFAGVFGAAGLVINSGGTVQIDTSNGLTGNSTAAGNFVPVTVNTGGTLAATAGTSSHIRGLLTLRGGTLAAPGTDASGFGNWDLDGGVAAGGVAATSTISGRDIVPSQTGATLFNVSSGATNGIDLDVTGSLVSVSQLNATTVTKTGAGTMRFSGANSYAAATAINGGILAIGHANALTFTSSIKFGGGTLQYSASNAVDYSNKIASSTAGPISIDTNGQTVTFATALPASNTAGLTKLGTGTLNLNGVNLYTGNTAIAGGIVKVNANTGLGAISGGVTLSGGGTLQAGGTLTTSRAFTLGTGGGVIDTNAQTVTLSSSVSGTALTKSGNGILNLSGTQTYAALTTTGGITNVNTALGAGAAVNAGATTNFAVSQTLASLTIGNGVEVTFGNGLPFAAAFTAEAVPEPGALGLLMLGALGLLSQRSCRAKTSLR